MWRERGRSGVEGSRVSVLKRSLLAVLLFAAGVAVGYALRDAPRAAPPDPDAPDRQIRPGRVGFTNPLLDCEVTSYVRGRELPSFKKELEAHVAGFVARGEAEEVALYFRDLDNGPWSGIREKETFTAASLLKVPLLMACLLQAETDPGFLRSTIRYEGLLEKEGVGGFVAESPLVVGRAYTVEDLIEQVAVYSDNYAAQLLDDRVNRDILGRLYRDLGLDPELVRDPLKPAAISPKAYGQLFRVLYNASYLNRENSEKLLAALSRAAYADGLVAGVPPGTVIAHKFGVNTLLPPGPGQAQLHDCGIVYEPKRPYFLCVMTRGSAEQPLAGVIAETSRFIWERIEAQGRDLEPISVK